VLAHQGRPHDLGDARHAIGRLVDVEMATDDRADALAQLERMCEQLLANPLIEDFEIQTL